MGKVDLTKIFVEEDMFPREISQYEVREYGFLFYNADEKDSFDSNHALIFKKKIHDIDYVLNDIKDFYLGKVIVPSIYQSIDEEGYFLLIGEKLEEHGFKHWTESQNFMVLSEDNRIEPNHKIIVRKITEWKDEYGVEIFQKADEPWEMAPMKCALKNSNTLFFVAFIDEKPVGMMHGHVTDGICRVDYLLVSKEYRKMGVGKTITHFLVEYCNENRVKTCFLWPDDEYAEKIYYEAGFRTVSLKKAGRAFLDPKE